MAQGNIRFDFSGQAAVVTGAGQGLGRTVALALAGAGARVAAADIEPRKAAAVVEEIRAAGGDGLAVTADLGRTDSIAALIEQAAARWGRIDVLVNNAGIAHRGDIFSLQEEEWDRLMAVNLRGVWVCSREALKVMIRQGSGRIVNVGSISGWLGGHEVAVDYAVSKAGVAVLTKRLANEMASRGITVNSVAPHALESPMTEAHGEEGKKRILAKIPMGRLGKLEEVAAAILFLASREAGYITGQTLHINGGALMVY